MLSLKHWFSILSVPPLDDRRQIAAPCQRGSLPMRCWEGSQEGVRNSSGILGRQYGSKFLCGAIALGNGRRLIPTSRAGGQAAQ
jgi:hypothetical protein